MVRYIDAIKIIKDLQSEYHGMISDESLKIYKIIYRLNTEPTADVEEVKHGEWIDANGIRKSKCSNCGTEYERVMEGYHCPICRAFMDGGKEE